MQETLVREYTWRRDRLPTPVLLGFPCGSAGKESEVKVAPERPGFDPWVGKIPGEGKGYPLQYSGLENSMDYPWGCKESDTTEQLSLHYLGKENWVLSKKTPSLK